MVYALKDIVRKKSVYLVDLVPIPTDPESMTPRVSILHGPFPDVGSIGPTEYTVAFDVGPAKLMDRRTRTREFKEEIPLTRPSH